MTHRCDRRGLNIALVAAGVILLVGAIVACAIVRSRPEPAPAQPVSQVEPWCVDPATMQLLDDDWCEDDDDDHHGVVFFPPHGVRKPSKGAVLPAEARPAWSVRPSSSPRIPAQGSGQPSVRPSSRTTSGPLVQLPGRSTPKPAPKKTR